MPSLFAYVALFLFPVVVVVLFQKFDRPSAAIWSIVLGYLFLPERVGIDLPVLPEYNKVLVPSLFAVLMALTLRNTGAMRAGRNPDPESAPAPTRRPTGRRAPILRSRLTNVLIVVLVLVVPLGVVMTNSDPMLAGPDMLPGMAAYDAGSMALNTVVMLLPFLLGRYLLHSIEAQLTLLKVFIWGGLAYSLLILFEIRMSPQLHVWIYGFFPHESFFQHIRGGSYRPIVFLEHGLLVGMYMACAVLAAACLFKLANTKEKITERHKERSRYGLMLAWLFIVFVLSRNFGALIIILAFLPVMLAMSRKAQITISLVIVLMIGIYPMLRQAHLIPIETALSAAESISPDRAKSLRGRLLHEEALLYKAQERPVFGWGGYGRQRLYDERGRDLSVTDGTWIITFGTTGWVGYIAQFGLLIMPIILLFRRRKNDDIHPASYGLALILTANLIDLLPNSSLTPLTWLVAGALLGATERIPVLKTSPNPRGAGQRGFGRASATPVSRRAQPATRRV